MVGAIENTYFYITDCASCRSRSITSVTQRYFPEMPDQPTNQQARDRRRGKGKKRPNPARGRQAEATSFTTQSQFPSHLIHSEAEVGHSKNSPSRTYRQSLPVGLATRRESSSADTCLPSPLHSSHVHAPMSMLASVL